MKHFYTLHLGAWCEYGNEDLLDRPIEWLDLSHRARLGCRQALLRNTNMPRDVLETLRHLITLTEDDLLESRNFGMTSLLEIREKLAKYGLRLRLKTLER